ncbi:MAG: Smr/MutS family protein [Deltaproteobacteria bacterium]|nr:Smr/MutS family protein [Deltaproteobacteria bacterium]
MGKKAKAGFNSPFRALRLPAAVRPVSPAKPVPTAPAPQDAGDDAAVFRAAMSGVRPLGADPARVEPAKRETSALPDDEQLAVLELESLVQGKGEFRVFEEEEDHSGLAAGASFALLARLKKGEFSWRRHLDLHGLHKDEAKVAVTEFVIKARKDGERAVLVITGRGRSSPDGVAVLRDILPRWLSRAPIRAHVLAFATARQVDGGAGAYYVLLRRPGVRPFGV